MGRKKAPSVSRKAASDAAKEPMTEADRAYARAVEVCDRIIRELDEQLED